jgi:hypothetical protein
MSEDTKEMIKTLSTIFLFFFTVISFFSVCSYYNDKDFQNCCIAGGRNAYYGEVYMCIMPSDKYDNCYARKLMFINKCKG